jgi:predicted PurR-regulated permease PerM
MGFDLARFIDTNKRFLIWGTFFLLLYLMRQLFGLLFLTFIIGYIFNNIVSWLACRTRVPRRAWTVVIYLLFLVMIAAIVSVVGSRLGVESKAFLKQVPETLDKLHTWLDRIAAAQPKLAPLTVSAKETLSLNYLTGMSREALVSFVVKSLNQVSHYLSFFLLGTLFSFLILLDLPNLSAKARNLRQTRIQQIYDETAESVAHFALVVGAAFQAQILIAAVNTFLTALGLWALNIEPAALLSAIVFFCGLIPVLGTFLSSAPILLLGFNQGGFQRSLEALLMIIIIHTIETYVLNPRIVSAVLKLNPVLTLIILYVGYNLLGFWGVLLGAPVSVYLYRYVVMEKPPVPATSSACPARDLP